MTTLADLLRSGYVPPTESALADPIKEHFKTLPKQLATNQAALDNAIASWNKTDFGTGLPNPNYRPEAINELTQIMPNMAGMIAYHGTPHNILGKFDISKVGTGEGAQAYGHGMYFAENPAVATEYAEQVKDLPKLGKIWNQIQYVDKKIKEAQKIGNTEEVARLGNIWQKLENQHAQNNMMSKGNLYKVDIPDEYIPNMLDWDKPFNQQPKGVKQLIEDAVQNENFDPFEYLALAGATKQHPRSKEYVPTGQEILNDLSTLYGVERNSKEFSDLLQSHGIKGISYLDADSRTGKIASNGTKNFVVFEPSEVKILEKNSKPVSRKELIEEQVKKLKD